jgi:hypothetical protein
MRADGMDFTWFMGVAGKNDDDHSPSGNSLAIRVLVDGVLRYSHTFSATGQYDAFSISLTTNDQFLTLAASDGEGDFWDAMTIVASVAPTVKLGKVGAIISRGMKWKWAANVGKYLGKLVRHHTVPTAVLEKLPAHVRNAGPVRGMAGQKNIWMIPEEIHKYLHGGPGAFGGRGGKWNEAWWRELDLLGGVDQAEVDDVVRIREKLVRLFGLEEYRP